MYNKSSNNRRAPRHREALPTRSLDSAYILACITKTVRSQINRNYKTHHMFIAKLRPSAIIA